jgi:GAF domain-containing protein
LCVPLKLGSWVIGVIDAQSSQPDAFEEKDVRRLGILAGQLATMLQSARLYEATRQRAAELALLYDATVAMSTAELDRTGVTELVMKRLISAIQVDGGRLGLWDHSTNTLVTRFVDGPTILTGQVSLENERQVEEYFLHYLLTGRKPLTLYENDPDLDQAVAQAMREKAIQSALILPLMTHNRVIGLVELTRTISHRFTPEEMRLALTLATQASIAMENARLYQETKLAVEELAALQALALDITAQIALPELLERLMMRARYLVRASGSAIYLMDLQDGALIPVGSDLPWGDIESSVVQKGLELAQDVIDGGRSLSRSTGSFSVPADAGEPVQKGQNRMALSCACVPLRWREQLVGVLSVFRAEDEPSFAAQQIYLLELLAPQAAIAIRNVQLYEELEQRMRDLELAQTGLIQAEKAAAIGRLAASLAASLFASRSCVGEEGDVSLTCSGRDGTVDRYC